MNRTIKEFAIKSKIYKSWFCDGDKIENFAELIVREMIVLAYDEEIRLHTENDGRAAQAIEDFRKMVKAHFGVE